MSYTLIELKTIIGNCKSWFELKKVCELIRYLYDEGVISRDFVRQSQILSLNKIQEL